MKDIYRYIVFVLLKFTHNNQLFTNFKCEIRNTNVPVKNCKTVHTVANKLTKSSQLPKDIINFGVLK